MAVNQADLDRYHPAGASEQRLAPNSIEAEQALLGALLIRNDAINFIPETFSPEHFFEPVHRQIFLSIKETIDNGKRANTVTVKTSLPDKLVDKMTMSTYLARLAAEAVSVVNLPDYAEAITVAAVRRSFISTGLQLVNLGYEPGEDAVLLENAGALKEQIDTDIRIAEGNIETTLAEAVDTAINSTNEAASGRGKTGVNIGFAPLTQMIGTLLGGQLIVVGGGTKQGKTSLIEQMAAGAAENGHHVWFYSGEMKAGELAQRSLSRLTGIQASRQSRGDINDNNMEALIVAQAQNKAWQERVIVRDKPMTLPQMKRAIMRFAKKYPNGVVVVDSIGLVERDDSNWRLTDQDFGPVVTRTLKQIAASADVPIIAAAQLKKNTFAVASGALTDKIIDQVISRRPRYADLMGACEKDANHVIFPFRAEPILQEMEPEEDTAVHAHWQMKLDSVTDRAEIILALSRHAKYPQKRSVGWNGTRTMFIDRTDDGQRTLL